MADLYLTEQTLGFGIDTGIISFLGLLSDEKNTNDIAVL